MFKRQKLESGESSSSVTLGKVSEVASVFADPTYDVTFKMLFGNEEHINLLISIINSFLNFKGEDQVKEATLLSQEIPITYAGQIKTILDIRCITNRNEEIIVEMQRQYKDYFLPRTQYYMARTLSGKMFEGESNKLHERLPKTYILVISREDLFTRRYSLDNDNLYEKTVVPIIKELGVEVPGNVMNWKYYEINKFSRLHQSGRVPLEKDGRLSIKGQWLNFLDKCSKLEVVPGDVDEIIKEAYEIMMMVNWDAARKQAYEKARERELDERDELAREKAESEAIGVTKGKAEGKAEEQLKLLPGIKLAIESKLEHSMLKQFFSSFEESTLYQIEAYINEHQNCKIDQIAQEIGLIGDDGSHLGPMDAIYE